MWKEFYKEPCLANFNLASYEQKVYEKAEIKVKYEKKIRKCFKSNCKPLLNYLKSKSTIIKSVYISFTRVMVLKLSLPLRQLKF